MYPDISYILYDLFQLSPDSNFTANIKTYGLFQLFSFVAFYVFTYNSFIKNEKVFYIKNSKKEISFIHFFLFLVILLSLNLSFWISVIILIALSFVIFSVEPPKAKYALYFYFLMGLLLVGYLGSSVQVKLEELYVLGHVTYEIPKGHGFFGGVLFIIIFLFYKSKGDIDRYLEYMSASSSFIFLSYAIGKMGCHLSGDGDWGKINTTVYQNDFLNSFLKSKYPHNVLNTGCKIDDSTFKYSHELCDYVYPLPLFESIFAIIVFVLMTFKIIPRSIVSLFILIGLMRFSFGFLNDDSTQNMIFGISYSQVVSLILIALAILIFFKRRRAKHSIS